MRFSVLRDRAALRTLSEVESEHIAHVLASVGGNRSRAAEVLGIDRKTLRDKVKRAAGGTEPDRTSDVKLPRLAELLELPFAPAIAVLNRLTFGRKFALIALLLSGPLAVLFFLQYSNSTEGIDFSARERVGIEYLRAGLRVSRRGPASPRAPIGAARRVERGWAPGGPCGRRSGRCRR